MEQCCNTFTNLSRGVADLAFYEVYCLRRLDSLTISRGGMRNAPGIWGRLCVDALKARFERRLDRPRRDRIVVAEHRIRVGSKFSSCSIAP